MKTIKVSATEARNRFFELIEMVAYKNVPVVVKKNNKDFVRIVAEGRPGASFISLDDLVKETFAMCPEGAWPYEQEKVKTKEKKANLDWEK